MGGKAKHQIYELKQKQSLPLEQKIILTKRRLEEWFNYWETDGGGVQREHCFI